MINTRVTEGQVIRATFSCNLLCNNVATLQVAIVCCPCCHLCAQQIFVLQKVERVSSFCNIKICCTQRWLYGQQTIATCNVTLLRDKLQENVARITWPQIVRLEIKLAPL